MLKIENVTKTFNPGTVNEKIALRGLNLHLAEGDFVTVIGGNGAGKSTMLNAVAGVWGVDSGTITIGGNNVTNLPEYKRARKIGRVFQNPAAGTVPGMTITENLALAENKGKPYRFQFAINHRKAQQFRELVQQLGLGLEDKMNVPVGLLSGGQRQALSLLMSTMTPIDLLLLDEHTAALDPHTAEIIMQLTNRIVQEKHITTIMVTHNLRYAVEYGSRLYMMDKGRAVLDCSGAEKAALQVDDILQLFNQISIECGN